MQMKDVYYGTEFFLVSSIAYQTYIESIDRNCKERKPDYYREIAKMLLSELNTERDRWGTLNMDFQFPYSDFSSTSYKKEEEHHYLYAKRTLENFIKNTSNLSDSFDHNLLNGIETIQLYWFNKTCEVKSHGKPWYFTLGGRFSNNLLEYTPILDSLVMQKVYNRENTVATESKYLCYKEDIVGIAEGDSLHYFINVIADRKYRYALTKEMSLQILNELKMVENNNVANDLGLKQEIDELIVLMEKVVCDEIIFILY